MNDQRAQLLRDYVMLTDGVLCWRKTGLPIKLQADKEGYLKFTITTGNTVIYFAASRAIWFLHYGQWPQHTIDHINRINTDNRIENLRDVTQRENNRNRYICFRLGAGVHWETRAQRWVARIKVAGRDIYLGKFRDRDDAVAARKAAETKFNRVVTPFDAAAGGFTPMRSLANLLLAEE